MDYKEMNTEFDVEFEEYVARKVAGTTNYMGLTNKPKINNVELEGNKTLEDLGIQPKGDYIEEEVLNAELDELVETFNNGMTTKQDKLVSGTNIKTINNQSILGGGNIEIETEETDPTVPTHVKQITSQDIQNWNNKSEFSGNYNDLTNKPAILTDNQVQTAINEALEGKIDVIIPYKASYTDEEKTTYGAKIFSCFDSAYTMLRTLYVSVSGLLLPYTGRINDNTLSFGMNITDITNGVHFVDYTMTINSETKTLESITKEPTIELVGNEELSEKQDKLVSGTNIKTINGNSTLGAGNIDLEVVKVLEANGSNVIDFNTLTEAGYYLIKNANASTTLNSPITDGGTYDMPLEVEKTILASGGTDYEQLVEGGIVYRKYTNGEWYDWGNVTEDMYKMSKTYTDSAIGGALSGKY